MLSVAAVQPRSAAVPVRVPDSVEAEGAVVSATAEPVTGMLTILPLESVTRRFAVLLPEEDGVNCTPISHPPSGSTGALQVLFGPILYCAALAPVRVAEAIVNGPFPLFPMTTLSSSDVPPTPVAGNARPVPGVGSETYITPRLEPLSAMARVPLAVSSVTVSVAAELLPGTGVKITSIVHLAPPSTVAGRVPHVFVWAKAA